VTAPRSRIAWGVVVVALASLAFVLWRAGNDTIAPNRNEPSTATHGRIEGRRAQFAAWSFDYDELITAPDQVTRTVVGIHDGVYYKDGRVFARMRALKITANTGTNDLTIDGHLHVAIDDKGKTRTLDTDRGTWSNGQQTLHLPGEVAVGSEGGARLMLHDVSVNFATGDMKVGRMTGGATL
jgi:hypothetical protein